MRKGRELFYILFLLLSVSCKNKSGKTEEIFTDPPKPVIKQEPPKFDFTVDPPAGWVMFDTVVNKLSLRFLRPQDAQSGGNPLVNILVATMEKKNIDEFSETNMAYLQKNMPGVVLQEKGSIAIPSIDARWFTYTKEQNGVLREMINYIIPLNGIAYMVTCGTNSGSMKKYRPVFDKIVRSFKG